MVTSIIMTTKYFGLQVLRYGINDEFSQGRAFKEKKNSTIVMMIIDRFNILSLQRVMKLEGPD